MTDTRLSQFLFHFSLFRSVPSTAGRSDDLQLSGRKCNDLHRFCVVLFFSLA